MRKLLNGTLMALSFLGGAVHAQSLDGQAVKEFAEYMVQAYQFDAAELDHLFSNTVYSPRIIDAMEKPAEALPWYKYRTIFVDSDRIEKGRLFWKEHEEALQRSEAEFGVPPGIIVAILGVETRYGANTGKDRVMDALATLAFHYPRRAGFFRDELEQFLLLSREQGVDPLSLKGSYAGAMGLPQFMPSSFRNYAVDFDHDGKINIWSDADDAIGSVANYFRQHGWETHQQIAIPARETGDGYRELLAGELRPDINSDELARFGILGSAHIPPDTKVKLISLESETGNELWLGFYNFYVITRYNRSPLYAMAVYQLYEEIVKKYQSTLAGY
ncbi:MAG: lytic murein transglycosylase B [Gammaproteobacteria bacterium]